MKPLALFLLTSLLAPAAERALPTSTGADSQQDESTPPALAFDGEIDDESRWLSDATLAEHWLVASFNEEVTLAAADIYSGYQDGAAIEGFSLQTKSAKEGWQEIPGTSVAGNESQSLRVLFEKPVTTKAVRFFTSDAGTNGQVRLRELFLWKDGSGPLPGLAGHREAKKEISANPVFDRSRHLVFLNQSGFNRDWPKRFTAPLTPDFTSFVVTPATHDDPLFQGTITNHVGDFTGFRPDDPHLQYVVKVFGGDLADGQSDRFFVAPFWMQRISLGPALRHFVDNRAIVGTHPGAPGATPWRDAPFYAYCTTSLVHLYLSNPSHFDQQRVEMNWTRDIARALAPGFPHDPSSGGESLQHLARMSRELDGPVGEAVPDIIQLIHWGISWWLLKPESTDATGNASELHPETIAIFAAYLYAHPHMREFFTDKFHQRVSEYAFTMWEQAGLFEVQTMIGTFQGRYPPGWTVLPNLMMHEVAKRNGRPDAERFLEAAVRQAAWVVDSVEFSDPLVAKGQRMSEHKTMSGLSILQRHFPEHAPEGLRAKLQQWAHTAVLRSNNLWDYRKYDNGTNWSLPRKLPGHPGGGSAWNDPGNLACFPGLAWQAEAFVEETEVRERLHEVAVAQWDILFGRNPLGCHGAWRGPLDFPGVERGWPVKPPPGGAQLHTVRGTLCASPATEHFPFNPAGQFRDSHGEAACNAAWNVALAESIRQGLSITVADGVVTVRGPLFVPEITVQLTSDDDETRELTLTATDSQQDTFRGTLPGRSPASIQYGHGFFASKASGPITPREQ